MQIMSSRPLPPDNRQQLGRLGSSVHLGIQATQLAELPLIIILAILLFLFNRK